jgi:hypothetical protein
MKINFYPEKPHSAVIQHKKHRFQEQNRNKIQKFAKCKQFQKTKKNAAKHQCSAAENKLKQLSEGKESDGKRTV